MNFSDRNLASLFMDGATIFLLLGMINHTTIYRQRRRTDDRLFFALLISDILIALCDIAVAIANGETFEGAKLMNLLCESLFYITEAGFAYLVVLFLDYRIHRDEERHKKMRFFAAIPITLVEIMFLIGVPNGYFISVDDENYYHYAKLYVIPVLVISLYAITALALSVVYKLKYGKTRYIPLWLYAIPVAGAVLPFLVEMAAMIPISLAVYLAYIHMGIMNEQFFENMDAPKGGAVK